MSKGQVYVISNPSMPGMVKIGLTTRTVQQRISELNRASGVPTPFKIEYVFEVSDCHAVEKAAHRELSRSRVASNREFFAVTPDEAKNVIQAISNRPPTNPSSGCLRFIAYYVFFVLILFALVFVGTAYAVRAHNISPILFEAIWANSCIIIPCCSAIPAWLWAVRR